MAHPMYVMRVEDVLALERIEPHQLLLKQGKVMVYDEAMNKPVIFVSHQWTSFSHPDHTNTQLHTLQTLLTEMTRGKATQRGASGGHPVVKKSEVELNRHYRERAGGLSTGRLMGVQPEWQAINWKGGKDTLVWIDYAAFSQPSIEVDQEGRAVAMAAMRRAVDSIPSYIARATLAVVLCPSIPHKDLLSLCDLASWLSRTWCSVESLSILIQPRLTTPAITCDGLTSPKLLDPWLVTPPGRGNLTCCRMGHKRRDPHGVQYNFECDKHVVSELVHNMLRLRIEYEERCSNITGVRMWRSFRPYLTHGLPPDPFLAHIDTLPTSPEEALNVFLAEGHYEDVHDYGADGKALFPLLSAALMGHEGLVRSVLEARADPTRRYRGRSWRACGLIKGTAPLHAAAAFAENPDVFEHLIRQAPQLLHVPIKSNVGPFSGVPALHIAAGVGNARGILGLALGCERAGVKLDVNQTVSLNRVTALQASLFFGGHDTVAALLKLGANVNLCNLHGGNSWTLICHNPRIGVETMELLARSYPSDDALRTAINTPMRARTLLWRNFDRLFQLLDALRISRSDLVRGLANDSNSTALHKAARFGRADLARWLLDHGAEDSLCVRTARGNTPRQLAASFGPFLEVEIVLDQGLQAVHHAHTAMF